MAAYVPLPFMMIAMKMRAISPTLLGGKYANHYLLMTLFSISTSYKIYIFVFDALFTVMEFF